MKLYTFQIPQNTRPGRLLPLAGRMLPQIPEYILRDAFRKRDVKVNGVRVGMDAQVIPGAEVKIYAREAKNSAVHIPILFEDENVLVVVKPVGISCEADGKGGRTLVEWLAEQMRQKDADASEPLLCHRLDNPTEGVLILAKNERIQRMLQDAFRGHQVQKTYECIVRGTPEPPHRFMQDWLVKDAAKARVRVFDRAVPGAKEIRTEYTVLESGECTRLSIRLHTGRTHQIRAHMAFVGHPLLGDDQYGDREFNKRHKTRRLMLCSVSLSFALEGELAYLNERAFRCKPSF